MALIGFRGTPLEPPACGNNRFHESNIPLWPIQSGSTQLNTDASSGFFTDQFFGSLSSVLTQFYPISSMPAAGPYKKLILDKDNNNFADGTFAATGVRPFYGLQVLSDPANNWCRSESRHSSPIPALTIVAGNSTQVGVNANYSGSNSFVFFAAALSRITGRGWVVLDQVSGTL